MIDRIPVMRLVLSCVCVAPLLSGCGTEVPIAAEPAKPQAESSTFDPANCGTLAGRVLWSGEIPRTAPFIYGVPLTDGNFDIRTIPNPNQPGVNAKTQALAGAVVFLRSINPARARPWDLPPVRVEMMDRDIRIVQGEAVRRIGFVRLGETVSMATVEPVFHVIRGRGAAFFSLAFPEPNQPSTRTLDTPGLVELTSGAGYYWANAHLFVAEHPYFAVTDSDGRFSFAQVPAGDVELVVWHPGWTVVKQERDPESGLITRLTYGPPLEVKHPFTVSPGKSLTVSIAVP